MKKYTYHFYLHPSNNTIYINLRPVVVTTRDNCFIYSLIIINQNARGTSLRHIPIIISRFQFIIQNEKRYFKMVLCPYLNINIGK